MRYLLFLFQQVAFGDAKETWTPIDGVKGRFPNLLEDGTVWWKEEFHLLYRPSPRSGGSPSVSDTF